MLRKWKSIRTSRQSMSAIPTRLYPIYQTPRSQKKSTRTSRSLSLSTQGRRTSLLTPPPFRSAPPTPTPHRPPSRSDIPLTRTTATQSRMDHKRHQREPARHPDEHHHARAHVSPDIKLGLTLGRVLEHPGYDGPDDGSYHYENGVDEADEREGEGVPPRPEHERRQEDEDEREEAGGQEEAEHDLRGEAEDVQYGYHFRGEGDGRARQ
jgi:hypothetical protein